MPRFICFLLKIEVSPLKCGDPYLCTQIWVLAAQQCHVHVTQHALLFVVFKVEQIRQC